ncbi:adenylyl-sulfate kinase [Thiobacillus sp.]|uniref:adenylyl-sulfate kinase n=1 Tax=Thiobacillus sp. TaxID=924 RepID=UPI00286D6A8F|nr:adenylyl-sulfate kinase [Thiobacillus sp.]
MVVWIIGLSGTGKSTLSGHVVSQMRQSGKKVVLLDGDVIRTLFGNDVDHTIEGRRKNAERLSHLSKFLSEQGVDVVAAVLSMFPEWRLWNRQNIPGYVEVYMRASMETLLARDIKNLYARALKGEITNVVGVDLPFPEPENPELIIDNDEDLVDFSALTEKVLGLDAVKKSMSV